MPRGIPHSVFLGRPVRPGDPQWLPTDRDLALAWQRNKAQTCTGCGTRADEWAEDDDAYIADHTTCEGCARRAEEQENNLEKVGDKPAPGQHVYLRPPNPGELDDDTPPDY